MVRNFVGLNKLDPNQNDSSILHFWPATNVAMNAVHYERCCMLSREIKWHKFMQEAIEGILVKKQSRTVSCPVSLCNVLCAMWTHSTPKEDYFSPKL